MTGKGTTISFVTCFWMFLGRATVLPMHSGLQLPELTVQKCTVLLVCAQIAYSRNDSLHTRLLAADWFPSTDIAALYSGKVEPQITELPVQNG